MYLKTDLLAGGLDTFGNCPMETGGKKSRITRRLELGFCGVELWGFL